MPAQVSAPPRHVAIVMDGNGRWARQRLLPRALGHKAGVDAMVRIAHACVARGIEHLTVFAFSSENWGRPTEEVGALMKLALAASQERLRELAEQGVRVRVVGDREGVAPEIAQAWARTEAATAAFTRLQLHVAFNYGGRWDLVQACRHLLQEGLDPQALDEPALAGRLALAHAPDPDLIIRTGGEKRLSNFLLWQAAYAELHFSDRLWPDFSAEDLDLALADFSRRDRRFGGRAEEAQARAPSAAAG